MCKLQVYSELDCVLLAAGIWLLINLIVLAGLRAAARGDDIRRRW